MLPFRCQRIRGRQILLPFTTSFLLRSTLGREVPSIKDYVGMDAIVSQETDPLHNIVDIPLP